MTREDQKEEDGKARKNVNDFIFQLNKVKIYNKTPSPKESLITFLSV